MNYGPIKLENKLIEEMKNYKNQYPIQILLNKNQIKNAEIRLSQKSNDLKLYVKIQNKQEHIINLDKFENNYPNKGLIRVYPDEPNCVGLYINHQIKSFMSLLKQFKICCHYGHYLKIMLADRITRDIFICQLIKRSNFKI